MKTKPIWIIFALTFGIWAINDEFGLGLPQELVDLLSIVGAASFLLGLGAETWKDWKEEYGGAGGAALSIASLIWKVILGMAFIAVGIFIITSLFANPMMTLIGIFVGVVLFAVLFS